MGIALAVAVVVVVVDAWSNAGGGEMPAGNAIEVGKI